MHQLLLIHTFMNGYIMNLTYMLLMLLNNVLFIVICYILDIAWTKNLIVKCYQIAFDLNNIYTF